MTPQCEAATQCCRHANRACKRASFVALRAQAGPSVQLRWRTLRRAVWALLRRAALAAVDYLGALALLALATGKLYAFQLACVSIACAAGHLRRG